MIEKNDLKKTINMALVALFLVSGATGSISSGADSEEDADL